MKYFSTFSGIGGFELGIALAYENKKSGTGAKMGRERSSSERPGDHAVSDNADPARPVCVGFSEIDSYATAIYQRYFPEHKNYGDIKKINADELPDFDLLVGGFPCQSFSIAGKRRGFEDTRGTMFFELARILRTKKPKLFVFENVKGLISHDGGRTFSTIIATLDELGYDCQWQVLNSKNHGVPQNRERIFIIGSVRGSTRPQVFPFITAGTADIEESTSTAIDANYGKGIDNHGQRTAIIHNIYGGFKEKKPRVFTENAPTIRTSAGGGHLPSVLKDARIRRLTPTECERLQSFPDGWTEGISDTQRYKCLGNAVTVNVVRDIFERIYE